MRKFLVTALSTVAFLSIAAVAFAQDGGSSKLDATGLMVVCVAATFSMAIAVVAAALAQASGLKAACEGVARNPEAQSKIMQPLIIGLAFIESLAIYVLVVNLILLVANSFA